MNKQTSKISNKISGTNQLFLNSNNEQSQENVYTDNHKTMLKETKI
jgi:hypothetical protein